MRKMFSINATVLYLRPFQQYYGSSQGARFDHLDLFLLESQTFEYKKLKNSVCQQEHSSKSNKNCVLVQSDLHLKRNLKIMINQVASISKQVL